jgi:ADP-ribosylglycohydrolase
MALMLARSIIESGGFEPRAALGAYVHWFDGRAFDMGRTTATALSSASAAIRAGHDPVAAVGKDAVQSSEANGALMRVSPLGILGHAASNEQLARWARADAALTHPNQVCQDASAVFVVAVAHAIRTGEPPKRVYEAATEWATSAQVCDAVLGAVRGAAGGLPAQYFSHMGWVLIALRNAFYQLLHAGSVEQGVVDTVMRGGDTDTNAAICGALLGAAYGARSMPTHWKDRVLSCRPLAGLPGVLRQRPREFWPIDAEVLAERLLVLGRAQAGHGGAREDVR